jgi:type II secretory pathway pseudopilin PulG
MAATVVVVVVIIASIVLLGSPAEQRRHRLDERRVDDLMTIESAIGVYWHRGHTLPADLAALSNEPGLRANTHDPETGSAYEYEITARDSYRLCATFAFDSSADLAARSRGRASKWSHGAGRHCFDLRISTEE